MASNVLDPTKTINGSLGELYEVTDDGMGGETLTFLGQFQRVEGKVVVDRLDVNRSGTRRRGYKRGTITIEGTLTGYKVTSRFLKRLADEAKTETAPSPLVLDVKLDDPEALGTEVVRLEGVQLWEDDFGWSVGDLVEEAMPFTATDVDVTTEITGDPLES